MKFNHCARCVTSNTMLTFFWTPPQVPLPALRGRDFVLSTRPDGLFDAYYTRSASRSFGIQACRHRSR